MGDLVKSFTAGFSRFALTWLLPSGAFLLAIWLLLAPRWGISRSLVAIDNWAGAVGSAVVLALISVITTLVFSLASLPVYRLLEGYSLPHPVRRAWTRRQLVRKRRLSVIATKLSSAASQANARAVCLEQLSQYPQADSLILPTRLGNAYKALESYGYEQFGLDSQSLWYELQAVSSERLRQDSDDARASVDFFISFTVYLGIYSILALATFALTISSGAVDYVAIISGALAVPLSRWSYLSAVRNTTDWRWSVQALVHVNRKALADALGYRVPTSLKAERELWQAWSAMANRRDQSLARLDRLRLPPEA